jgi:HD-like signal output (HDOD) protein
MQENMTMSTATPNETQQAAVLLAVKQVSTIATLPEVTAKIVATVEDPRSTAAQLHKIVSHDPALVTRILKVVNSAFYGLPGQIASIERAIVLLGLNAVKNIAVAASLGQLFRGVKLCDGFTARDLWTHCITVGVAARELAKAHKLPLADEAFLAGLIHDVGILISLQLYPEKLAEICQRVRDTGARFVDVEQELLKMDHQQLGAALAAQWKFPRACQLAAGQHHSLPIKNHDVQQLLTLVHIADTLACQANLGFNLTALHQELDDTQLGDLDVDLVAVEQVRKNLPELAKNAASLFS